MRKVIENEMIPDFPEKKDFNIYYKRVMKDYKNISGFFPYLKITNLITCHPKEIFIYGNLIPYQVAVKCQSNKDIQRNSLYIIGIYSNEFPNKPLYIVDFYEKIKWSQIPEQHRHRRKHPETDIDILCTHHPNEEINEYSISDRNIVVLSSAWKLYIQFKN